MDAARFDPGDFDDEPPGPGSYGGTITTARLRTSARGHRMVAVVVTLDGAPPGRDRVADHFVLEGATPRGLQVARWRLVALYRACGVAPRDGDEIRPGALVGSRVAVTLEHEHRDGRTWARVAGYRPLHGGLPDDEAPF
ncbi:MAG: DUF669 domain-containing protein [Chloroflexi bacterium]|nr:DUF669 domain-containing protein [Chloroflexota bacterium]